MRARWYFSPLLYGLGVFLGLLVLDLVILVRSGSFPSLLGDPSFVYLMYWGAYVLGAPIWITLIPVSLFVEAKHPRLAAAIPVLTGAGVAIFGFLVVIGSILRSMGP